MSAKTISAPQRVPYFFIGSLLLFAMIPMITLSPGESERQTAVLADDAEARELRNQSAIAVILGEFRANISDLIFIKTERYLHNGVAMMPHLDMGEMARSGSIQAEGSEKQEDEEERHDHSGHAHGDHHHHEGESVETVIKPSDEDFRGFIGNLEREVKPWLPPGSPDHHTSGTELLPWYRLATLGNPQNERAYMVGAWWLKGMESPEQQTEALGFIEEGIANNPRSFQLHLMRGYLLRQLEREDEAMESFKKAAEHVIAARPADGKIGPVWTDHLEEQATAAMTMALLSVRDQKSPKEALGLAEAYEARMGTLPLPIERIKGDIKRMVQEEEAG